MVRRIFLVGTDTDCGKTTVACALLRAAAAAGVRALPFKPAASGATPGDPERLVAAAAIAGLRVDEICPLRYTAPVAPGLAAPGGLDTFVRSGSRVEPTPEIGASCERLGALEEQYRPALSLIEGAGGLLVPMPGGSWLPAWIAGFGAQTIVVGRLGLGTINHCLLTFAALEQFGVEPRGFILAQTHPGDDPSHAHNERVIVATSGVPCLGVLAFGTGEQAHGWLRGGVAALLK
jgi:dethiobiotin synthetase